MGNEDYKTVIEKSSVRRPNRSAQSKLYISGDIVEIQTMDRTPPNVNRYRRLNRDSMLDTYTGEFIRCNRARSRLDNRYTLMKSMLTVKRLVNCNFTGSSSELHIILTYQEKMCDTEKLYQDFRKFWSKLQYRYPSLQYISIAEPQRTGTWHFHLLVRDGGKRPLWIENKEISNLWGHGFTKTVRVPRVTNFGIYFVARLIHDDPPELTESQSREKHRIKGGRLRYYPARFRFYRVSKGIERPIVLKMSYAEAEQLIRNSIPLFETTKDISRIDENGETTVVNSITYQERKLFRTEGGSGQ